MRVLVTGASGLIGGELVTHLGAQGHEVTRLVRRPATQPGEAFWDPAAGTIEADKLERHDAVVHLAGVGIGDHRWSDDHKRAVLDSRVKGTDLLARTLAGLAEPPKVFASGSAVGFYGYESDQPMTEAGPRGAGFLADVVGAWEDAAAPAADAGIRVVLVRSGVVLTAKGGALKTGRQWLSWISLDDEVAAIAYLLAADAMTGPVNVTSPNPVTNKEFTATLARVLKRPAFMPVPTPALHALFGDEMTKEMLLGGQRALPAALEASGYRFAQPTLEAALRQTLGR